MLQATINSTPRITLRNFAGESAGALLAKPGKKPRRGRKRTTDSPKRPGEICPVMTPEEFYENLGKLKQEAEIVIDKLIDIVDRLDAASEDREPDVDGEPAGDDEPTLGWLESEARFGRYRDHSAEDLEDEHDGGEPDADREPDVDDELTGDDEPSLGAAEPTEHEPRAGSWWAGQWHCFTEAQRGQVYNQRAWGRGGDYDYEADDADLEPARTDPAWIAAVRKRVRSFEPTLQIDRKSDGRLVQVSRLPSGRICNVRPLTPEEWKRVSGWVSPAGQSGP